MSTKAEIDWSDPDAVAALRGDAPEEEAEADNVDNEASNVDKAEDNVDKAEEEPEVGAEPEKEKEPMLPKSRYDSKAKQVRELEAKLAEYEQQVKTEKQVEEQQSREQTLSEVVASLDKDINQAIADDEMDRATFLRQEQRKLEKELFMMEAGQNDQQAMAQTREQLRLDDAISQIEQTFPQFDPNSNEYQQEIVDQVQELRFGLEATGRYSSTQALIKAMSFVVPEDDIPESGVTTPEADAAVERTKKALEKSVEAATKQPADSKDTGLDADKAGIQGEVDAMKLNEKDFNALPEDTLKRLRGDFRV